MDEAKETAREAARRSRGGHNPAAQRDKHVCRLRGRCLGRRGDQRIGHGQQPGAILGHRFAGLHVFQNDRHSELHEAPLVVAPNRRQRRGRLRRLHQRQQQPLRRRERRLPRWLEDDAGRRASAKNSKEAEKVPFPVARRSILKPANGTTRQLCPERLPPRFGRGPRGEVPTTP